MKINIAKDFSDAPGGRNISDGEYSGEKFRKDLLESAFEKNDEIIKVELDGTFGYPPSFLEEAFGGLVRTNRWTEDEILKRLDFVSNEDSSLPETIRNYIRNANND